MAKFNMKGKKRQAVQKNKKGSKKDKPQKKQIVKNQKKVQKNVKKNVPNKNIKKKAQVEEDSSEDDSNIINTLNDDESDSKDYGDSPRVYSSDVDMNNQESEDDEEENEEDEEKMKKGSKHHGMIRPSLHGSAIKNNVESDDDDDEQEESDDEEKDEQDDDDDDDDSDIEMGDDDEDSDVPDTDDSDEDEQPIVSKNAKQNNQNQVNKEQNQNTKTQANNEQNQNKSNKGQNQNNKAQVNKEMQNNKVQHKEQIQNNGSQNQISFDSKNEQEFPPSCRVYVRNFHNDVTEEAIKSFFESKSLNVVDIFLSTAKPNNLFCFVEFKTLDEARTAVSLDGTDFNGLSLSIAFSKPRNRESQPSSEESKILFVKNLGPSVTKENVEDHFGKVQEVRLMLNQDGSCRGHAYVEFFSSKDAIDAKERLSGSSINGSNIFIDFAKPRNNQGYSNERGTKFHRGNRGGFGGNRGGFGGNRGGNRGFAEKSKNRFFKGDNESRGSKFGFGGRGRGNKFQGQSQKITFNDDD